MSKNITTAIEITDTHVKLLQARNQRGLFITHGSLGRIEQFTDDHVANILTQMTSARGFEAGEVVGIIPRKFAILKHISLPSQSDAEIKRMLDLQIGNHVPYSREDIVFDFQIVGREASGYTEVLLMIVHRDVMQRYLRIFEKVRLHPHRFVLSSFGVLEWFVYQLNKTKEKDDTVALINIDDAVSEIVFCSQKKMVFSRSIHFGAKDLGDEHLAVFMEQIGLTLGNYKKEKMGPDITRFVVVTNIKEAARLIEKLKEYYQLPVDVRSALDNLPCHKDLNLSSLWQESGLSVVSPVGFLLGDVKKQFNFMPLNIQVTKKSQLQKRALLKLATMSLLTVVLAMFAFNISFYHDTIYLKKIQDKIKETRPQVEAVKTRMESIEFLRSRVKNPVRIADIVNELHTLCPKEISFNALYLDSQGTLTIQGISTAGNMVNTFQGNLVNSPLFTAVNLEFATKRKRLQEEYTDFKIICKLALKEKRHE